MNPVSVRPVVILVLASLVVGAIAGGAFAWWIQGNRWQVVVAGKESDLRQAKADHSDLIAQINRAAAEAILVAQGKAAQAQRHAALIDETMTARLRDEERKSGELSARLAAGERLRVAGRCAPGAGDVPGTSAAAGAAGVDDGGTVELSRAAGRDVQAARAGAARDRTALIGLQRWVREVCLAP